MLVEKGASFECEDSEGKQPIDLAKEYKYEDVANYLDSVKKHGDMLDQMWPVSDNSEGKH